MSLKILGVMTGTSCDGLDAACVQIDKNGWQPLWARSFEYPARLKARVLKVQKPNTTVTIQDLYSLHRDLGIAYGAMISEAILSAPKSERPDLVACHGQTIGHFPGAEGGGFTVQIADPTHIAKLTGLTVVSNFRDGDMAAGGQGAPLVPLFHSILASALSPKKKAGVAIHNIGGISNLTYIGPKNQILAFDTGPGNLWIDACVQTMTRGKEAYDRDGARALDGEIDIEAVTRLLKNPFFKTPPPKSTGRDDFPFELFLKEMRNINKNNLNNSVVATATALTVESIGRAYEQHILRKKLPLHTVYICGGGAKNHALTSWLQDRLPTVTFSPLEASGLDPQYIEAQAFALYGYMSLQGSPLGGSWTGVRGFGSPGHITPGKNWGTLFTKLD